jgi:hypothetical protein
LLNESVIISYTFKALYAGNYANAINEIQNGADVNVYTAWWDTALYHGKITSNLRFQILYPLNFKKSN